MTKATLVKFEIKPDAKRIWLDWSLELQKRKEEVIATLKNEGVVSESCFISEDGKFVYYFMEAHDMEKARKAVVENPHPIDIDHRNNRKASLKFICELECLFHFENRD